MSNEKNHLGVYIPKDKRDKNLFKRMKEIAEENDRSFTYLLLEAVSEYLDKEEVKN